MAPTSEAPSDLAASAAKTTYATVTAHSGKSYNLPTGLFINNQFVPSKANRTFETVNPVNETVLAHVSEALAEDVDAAVAAASAALPAWRKVKPMDRSLLLNKLANLLEANQQLLAEIESLDNGKPVGQALGVDLALTIQCYRYYAGWADKIHGKVLDIQDDMHSYTRMEPFGVVGQIIPWNFPLIMMAWKLGPALATGNVVIMKTSEKTPLSALKVAELIVEAGFPPGVVNILSGFGPTAGEAIVRHPKIVKVAFTGSTATGRRVMIAAAESNIKKVSLELGGKSPNIVFDDADLDSAVEAASVGIFLNHGQCCCAGSRVYVQEGIYDEFVARFKAVTDSHAVGDPCDPKTFIGPLVDAIQFDRVMSYIESGKTNGATVLTGGKRVGTTGFFVEPTVFTDVREDMPIAREEIFGPVVSVMKFKTLEEVVERANASPYGLAAAVHTKNLNTAVKCTNELKAGTVWVNCYNVLTSAAPFGGVKESGIGRELGKYALQEYTEVKSVLMAIK